MKRLAVKSSLYNFNLAVIRFHGDVSQAVSAVDSYLRPDVKLGMRDEG